MTQARLPRRKIRRKFGAHEAIRVVPLHHPQFQRAAAPNLTYRGGALIEAAKVYAIFWGRTWTTNADIKGVPTAMNTFFSDILISPLIDQLSEYNVAGLTIGHGSFIGLKVITAGAPASSVTDLTIQKALQNWISAGTAPQMTKIRFISFSWNPASSQ